MQTFPLLVSNVASFSSTAIIHKLRQLNISFNLINRKEIEEICDEVKNQILFIVKGGSRGEGNLMIMQIKL